MVVKIKCVLVFIEERERESRRGRRTLKSSISELSYSLVKATKVYNDTLKVYEAKLMQLGLSEEEIKSMGFTTMKTPASEQPASLVGC